MHKKTIITVMPLALHAKFQHKTSQEGLPMSRVVRALIGGYLDGEFVIGVDRLRKDRIPFAGRPSGSKVPDQPANYDFYDELYEKVTAAVEG